LTDHSHNSPNRLQNSASPYLRSAARQPIDWHEWNDEAFAHAKAQDKPILLDIGAVWCHWCHVIDRESYENQTIAKIINENFVAIKVDRDERPDVDSRYQSAISTISGQGGWPLTGFLLPDGKPFFGGTYFPPEDQFGRPGFRRVLLAVSESYKNKRAELESAAGSLLDAVTRAEIFTGAHGAFDIGVVESQIKSLTQLFDIRNGGFGGAPKFPHCSSIDLILEEYQRIAGQAASKGDGTESDKHLLAMAETTLEKMARGGVYDQLAGGFHRYSVDEKWQVPHFEKMSYDNSELLKNYLHAATLSTKHDWEASFHDTAQGIVLWVNQVLSDQENGGFYASQDADYSLDDDGDYFTWTLEEIHDVLTEEESRVIELYYDIEAHGEMHHNSAKNVLWIARGFKEIADALGKKPDDIVAIKLQAESKMLKARARRPTPFVDKTMYVSWNAMFVTAYLEASRALNKPWLADDCRKFALKTMDRMLAETWTAEKGFAHRIGGPALDGSLDDQVFGAIALLDSYEATLEERYFSAARRTVDLAIEKYGDADGGGFFDRSSEAPPMGGLDVRRKPFQDSPTPGGNSVAAIVLTRLYRFSNEAKYAEWAQKTLEAFAGIAPQYGMFAATYGLAATLYARHPAQVVITGAPNDPTAAALEAAANSVFRYGKSVLRILPGVTPASLPVALRETLPHLPQDQPLALVCSGNACFPPTSDPERLKALLLHNPSNAVAS